MSNDQHEVGQNEDDVQHINVSAPGRGNGKFTFFFINFTYVFVSNTVYIILSLVFVTVMLYLQ